MLAAISGIIVGSIGGISSSMGRVWPVGAGGGDRGWPGQRAGRAGRRHPHRAWSRRWPVAYLGGEYKLLATFMVLVVVLMAAPLRPVWHPRNRTSLKGSSPCVSEPSRKATSPTRRCSTPHPARLAGHRCRAAGALSLHGQRLLALPRLPGGHQCGQHHRAQHPHRLHRPGQPGAGRLHGPGCLHAWPFCKRATARRCCSTCWPGRGGHAGRHGGGHSLAAREGAVPGDRDHRRVVDAHFVFANLACGHRRPRRASPCRRREILGMQLRHLVPPVLAVRADHRADAAGRGQPVSHPHRPRFHRDPRPRHLGRGAGHPAAAIQAAVALPCRPSTPAWPGGLWAYFFRVVTPESFPLTMSIFFLAAVIVGGMGTILGGILRRGVHDHGARAAQAASSSAARLWPRWR